MHVYALQSRPLGRLVRRAALVVHLTLAAGLALSAAPALAQSTTFTYQGQLKQAGAPFSGNADLVFVLYSAETGGAPVAAPVGLPAVAITAGLFTVPLDFGAGAFNGERRWLDISVNGATLTPRQEVTPAPYAMFANRPWVPNGANLSYVAGNVGIGTSSPATRLDVVGTAKMDSFRLPTGALSGTVLTSDASGNGTWQSFPGGGFTLPYTGSASVAAPNGAFKVTNTGTGQGLWGVAAGTGASGVYGQASATTGFTFGGLFESSSPDGRAVRGANLATTGLAVAGRFGNNSPAGISVWSTAGAATGATKAVFGENLSASDNAIGVHGLATGATGFTFGGRFESLSTTGIGAFGYALPATGATSGLYGRSDSVSGSGVYGLANSPTGNTFGGHFFCNSPDGRAIRAVNNALTGQAVAGRFGTGSPAGIGVWTSASATSGLNYGVYADTSSPGGRGVLGYATATTGNSYGVHGLTNGSNGVGVVGQALATSGNTYGVYGVADSTSGIGVFGLASNVNGIGGYFRNTIAGSTALYADGLCKVKTLQILGGADLAEPFDVNSDATNKPVEPGMVVVIDEANPGDLRLTDRPYDTQVAGVISGANGLQPGMVMKAEGTDMADGAHPVAMTGRVWCYVDASSGAISPGDRLTTSATPGHAMKADDASRCGGAVFGKAMSSLAQGERGLVLVLVNLQ